MLLGVNRDIVRARYSASLFVFMCVISGGTIVVYGTVQYKSNRGGKRQADLRSVEELPSTAPHLR